MYIYKGDLDLLADEGWQIGAHHSCPGAEGYYVRHGEHHPGWIKAYITPCGDDSIEDDEGFCGPSGPCNSATEAFLDRL